MNLALPSARLGAETAATPFSRDSRILYFLPVYPGERITILAFQRPRVYTRRNSLETYRFPNHVAPRVLRPVSPYDIDAALPAGR
jgi:hypothetical protein